MIQLFEVGEDTRRQREFILLPVRLYANDNNWIRPLDQDIEAVFSPIKNKMFTHGEAVRWIATDASGKTVGRVAAFIDHEKAHKEAQPTGGMGFFECEDDYAVAEALFEACRNWLAQRGMAAMDGPINFGERDGWWGLMVKGWDFEPTYKMPWTKPYYVSLFEQYGFKDYFQQYVYVSSIQQPNVVQSVEEKAERIYANPDYSFQKIEKKRLPKYAEDFRAVYNAGWAKFPGVKPMSSEQAMALVKTMKPILDEDLIWFAYAGGEPVAFFIVIPDINQVIKHLNGKFGLLQKLKFLYLLKIKRVITRTNGVIFGVAPSHQGRGVESAIALKFRQAGREIPNYQYNTIDMNWVGDFNLRMLRFASQLGGSQDKTYITYRYLFDRTQEFKRCERI